MDLRAKTVQRCSLKVFGWLDPEALCRAGGVEGWEANATATT